MKAIWWRSMLVVAAVVAVVLVSGAGVARADSSTGTGTLHAQGYGTVGIRGSGMVEIGQGAGTVWIKGADEIESEGRGRKTELPDGTIRLTGYSGEITITGQELQVRIVGGAIDVTATGTGTVVLRGQGTYETNSSSGEWSPDGEVVGY